MEEKLIDKKLLKYYHRRLVEILSRTCQPRGDFPTVEEMYNHMIQMSYGIRKSYETLDLAKQDINPIDLETSKPLEVGQLVSVVSDTDTSNNAIYRLASISADGTPTWERQAALGDLSTYGKKGGYEGTLKDLENLFLYEIFNSKEVINKGTLCIPFTLYGAYFTTNGTVVNSQNWISAFVSGLIAGETITIDGLPKSGITNRVAFYSSDNQSSSTVIFPIVTSDGSQTIEVIVPNGAVSMRVNIAAVVDVGASPSTSNYNDLVKIIKGNGPYSPTTLRAEAIVGEIKTEQIACIEQKISNSEMKLGLIKETYDQKVYSDNFYTSGALRAIGGGTKEIGYVRTSYSIPSSMIPVREGYSYAYTGEITSSQTPIAGVHFIDGDLKFISSACTDVKVYDREVLSVPKNAVYIATCSYGQKPIIDEITYSAGNTTVYVDVNFSGISDGSKTYPFSSISDAVRSVTSSATFVIAGGDYRETLPLGELKSGSYKFIGKRGQSVRILGSEQITGWAKTSGYTNVYQAVYSGSIRNITPWGTLLFEDKRPSAPIEDSERHPLQKGLSYRLPFTPIVGKSSISEVDSNKGTFYHDADTNTLYIHTSTGTNPASNGYSYENIIRSFNDFPASDTDSVIDISLENLQFMFGKMGVVFRGFKSVFRRNVSVLASSGGGAFCDDVAEVVSYNDEAAFCNNDGINGHYYHFKEFKDIADNRAMSPTAVYFDPWVHDNFDDGMSHHESHIVSVHGMLSEYNADAGVRASNDASYTIYNAVARYNGLIEGGEGFGVVNSVINPNRNGCKMICFNCLSEGNNRGYASKSDSRNTMELVNCISRNSVTGELFVTAGKIVSRNSYASNEDPLKIKVNSGGVIDVRNDKLIVLN